MKKYGFDNERYLDAQRAEILKRAEKFRSEEHT